MLKVRFGIRTGFSFFTFFKFQISLLKLNPPNWKEPWEYVWKGEGEEEEREEGCTKRVHYEPKVGGGS